LAGPPIIRLQLVLVVITNGFYCIKGGTYPSIDFHCRATHHPATTGEQSTQHRGEIRKVWD